MATPTTASWRGKPLARLQQTVALHRRGWLGGHQQNKPDNDKPAANGVEAGIAEEAPPLPLCSEGGNTLDDCAPSAPGTEHVSPPPEAPPAARVEDSAALLQRLLPGGRPPKAALLFIEGRVDLSIKRAKLEAQYGAAVEWLCDALCHAHADRSIKHAARELLVCQVFTTQLDEFHSLFFSRVLRPHLNRRLVTLGSDLAEDFVKRVLGVTLAPEKVAAAIGRAEDHPLWATARARGGQTPTQLDLLPAPPNLVAFDRPWEYPEHIYAHAVLMAAAAVDAGFQRAVGAALAQHNASFPGGGTAVHTAAAPKAHARVMTKASADYRGRPRPVSQNNIDVTRCLVTADTPAELLAVGKCITSAFGGVVKLKNLFSASEAERSARYHLLPLMLTVVVDGGGTYADVLTRPEVIQAIDRYVAQRDPSVPAHMWRETTTTAKAVLASPELADLPVRVLGEAQLVLTPHAETRHGMHEIYKAYRAETPLQLFEDYARTSGADGAGCLVRYNPEVDAPTTLFMAAMEGDRPAVERLLAVEAEAAAKAKAKAHGSKSRWLKKPEWLPSLPKGLLSLPPWLGGTKAVTPMQAAALGGWTDIVKVLLDAGADPEDTTDGSSQPLIHAAKRGHTDVVELLLQRGAKPNTQERKSGATALIAAAGGGFVDVVSLLLDANAEVDTAMTSGERGTALIIAIEMGRGPVVDRLLEARADPGQHRGGDGSTPLLLAAQLGHDAIAEALLGAGADPSSGATDGTTPLYLAVQGRHGSMVDRLVAAGADVNGADNDGLAPLMKAASNDDVDILTSLIAASANVDATTADGSTAVWVAASGRHTALLRKLIDAGAGVDIAMSGLTPLYTAILGGDDFDPEVVSTLLAAGADVNIVEPDSGCTPLAMAAWKRLPTAVAMLLAAGADPNIPTAKDGGYLGGTPLFLAAQRGCPQSTQQLIDAGSDVDAEAPSVSATPLYVAVHNNHVECVALLVAAAADVNCVCPANKASVLEVAARNKNVEILQLLKDAGAKTV